MRNPNCTLCPLYKNANTVCLWGSEITISTVKTRLMVVSEAPKDIEDIEGTRSINALLQRELRDIPYYSTSAAKCRAEKPNRNQIDACKGYLSYEIVSQDPEVILTLGPVAKSALIPNDWKYQEFYHYQLLGTLRIVVPTVYPTQNRLADLQRSLALVKGFVT